MNFYRWIRGYAFESDLDRLTRASRWACVLTVAMLVLTFARVIYFGVGASLGFGPQSVADREDIAVAMAQCGAVRAHLANFRSAPTRGDLGRVVAQCRAMEPLRQALASR